MSGYKGISDGVLVPGITKFQYEGAVSDVLIARLLTS